MIEGGSVVFPVCLPVNVLPVLRVNTPYDNEVLAEVAAYVAEEARVTFLQSVGKAWGLVKMPGVGVGDYDETCRTCGALVGDFIHRPSNQCGQLYGCTITPNHASSDHHIPKVRIIMGPAKPEVGGESGRKR